MKISNWVKLIGILCIVFGAYRIMSGVFELSLSQTSDTFPELLKPKFLSYTEIFINIAYVMAGIFFLVKKSFSLYLMYVVLIFKILYGIISLLFIKFHEFPVLNISLELFNPFYNVVLLIGVFKLAKYFFKSPQELAELSEKKIRRDIFTKQHLKILSITGILFLAVPLLINSLWIYSSIVGATQPESVSLFYSLLPKFLQGRFESTYLSMACCVIGIVLGIVCLKLRGELWIKLNTLVLVLCSIMLLWNLWTLM